MRRLVIVTLAIAAATLFLLSVQGGRWWSLGGVHVGPFGAQHCFGGDCRATGLGWLGDARWLRIGTATWAAGLIATASLLAFAAGVASKREARLLSKLAAVSVATAAVAGGSFFMLAPTISTTDIRVFERGIFLFVGAVVLGAGVAVAQLLSLRKKSPALATTPSP